MSMLVEDRVGRLLGKILDYSWGGYSFIPQLIGFRPEPELDVIITIVRANEISNLLG